MYDDDDDDISLEISASTFYDIAGYKSVAIEIVFSAYKLLLLLL